MKSLSDRSVRPVANRYAVANASQNVAVTAAETETAPEGRTPFTGETSTISSSNATRVAAPDVVAKPGDDMMTGTSTIEGIDLNAEIPCGHEYHAEEHPDLDAPAAYIARSVHRACGRDVTYPLCQPGWNWMKGHPLRCNTCGVFVDGLVRIVEVLR